MKCFKVADLLWEMLVLRESFQRHSAARVTLLDVLPSGSSRCAVQDCLLVGLFPRALKRWRGWRACAIPYPRTNDLQLLYPVSPLPRIRHARRGRGARQCRRGRLGRSLRGYCLWRSTIRVTRGASRLADSHSEPPIQSSDAAIAAGMCLEPFVRMSFYTASSCRTTTPFAQVAAGTGMLVARAAGASSPKQAAAEALEVEVAGSLTPRILLSSLHRLRAVQRSAKLTTRAL